MPAWLKPVVVAALVLATLLTIHVLPQLASVLLLLFAGTILAVVLDAMTAQMARIVPGGRGVAYAVTLAVIALFLAAIGALVGPRIVTEGLQVADQLPQAWQQLLDQLDDYAGMQPIVGAAQDPLLWLNKNANLMAWVSGTFGGVFNVLVVVLVAIYGAATPERYEQFGRQLLPEAKRQGASQLSGELGRGLRHWLLGRTASMSIVGLATGIGLWILGVPLAFTLGLFAGLASFVPYVGPIIGLVPAVLIASVHSLGLAGWVLVVYGAVQMVESSLLTPLIQQRAIALPPVVLIAAQMIGGLLVGPPGVLLAAPLVVVVTVTAAWNREQTALTRK